MKSVAERFLKPYSCFRGDWTSWLTIRIEDLQRAVLEDRLRTIGQAQAETVEFASNAGHY